MGVFSAMNVSATGMTAQQMRMDVIAQNIANATPHVQRMVVHTAERQWCLKNRIQHPLTIC